MWSFGASVQDENENVTINSPETVAAVEFMIQLFEGAMSDEVFAWDAASNNQGLVAGQLSFILNSISAWPPRTPTPRSPTTSSSSPPSKARPRRLRHSTCSTTGSSRPTREPRCGQGVPAPLHGEPRAATYHSKLYDLPAWASLVPDRDAWLTSDLFDASPPDKLALLTGATDWSTNIGHPGPASPAAEIFNTFVVSNMLARAANGEQTAAESVPSGGGVQQRLRQVARRGAGGRRLTADR